MATTSGKKPRSRRVEHELEHVPHGVTYLEPSTFVMHGQHDDVLKATAEVCDPRAGAHSRHWS